MPKFQFDIPFNQDKLITYLNKKENSILSKKLMQVRNISNANEGFCRGLSNLYLINENNNKGDELIDFLNSTLKAIRNQDGLFKIAKKNNSQEINVYKSLLNKYLTDGLNFQISYERSCNFNYIANKIDSLLMTNKNTELNEIIRTIESDKNIAPFKKNEKENNIKNLYSIIYYLRENIAYLNKKVSYLTCEYELIELAIFYYHLIHQEKEDSIEIYYSHVALSDTIKNKIISNSTLSKEEIRAFLANAFYFISKLEMYKNTARKINSGLINEIAKPIYDYNNLRIDKEQLTINELKTGIENKLRSNEDYYSLISYDAHCMAISIKQNKNGNNYTYKFFDPNRGVKKYNNQSDFLSNLKKIITHHSKKTIDESDIFKFGILSMDSFPQKKASDFDNSSQ